jgi:hypothetical protein
MLKRSKPMSFNDRPAVARPPTVPPPIVRRFQPEWPDGPDENMSAHGKASQGLAQTFGLDPRAAILTVIVDLMVFGADTISVETLLPLGVAVAAVLGYIVYRIQRSSYGDEKESAVTKGLIIFLLTAIPVPLSPIIAIPGGVIGIVKKLSGK